MDSSGNTTDRRKGLMIQISKIRVTFILLIVCLIAHPVAFASHPEPQESPDRSVDPTFAGWLAAFKKEALVLGISQATLDQALKDVKPIPRVIELDQSQPEFKLTFEQYFSRVVSKQRIKKGRELIRQNRDLLMQIQNQYGVQARFIVALWGMETDFGRITGGFSVVDALVTLAYDGRRSAYFRKELINALKIIDQGHTTPETMTGSWAGAMGQTQFMPSTFLSYAVDFSGDGKIDVWNTRSDALASGANYLSKVGWEKGYTWGREVMVPKGFDATLYSLDTVKSLNEWKALGVTRTNGQALPSGKIEASLINLDEEKGKYFLVYNNFKTIMHWNKSTSFATSVGILADAIGDI